MHWPDRPVALLATMTTLLVVIVAIPPGTGQTSTTAAVGPSPSTSGAPSRETSSVDITVDGRMGAHGRATSIVIVRTCNGLPTESAPPVAGTPVDPSSLAGCSRLSPKHGHGVHVVQVMHFHHPAATDEGTPQMAVMLMDHRFLPPHATTHDHAHCGEMHEAPVSSASPSPT